MKIIDPHIHLFNVEEGDYHWLKAENPPFWSDKSLINKSFTFSDIRLSSPINLEGFIHIEAGFDNSQPWRELEFLEEANLNQKNKTLFKAIASIDLTKPTLHLEQDLDILAKQKSFTGVRHIFDEQALQLLTDRQVLDNIAALNEFAKARNQGIVFETQLFLSDRQAVKTICTVIEKSTHIKFIINHAGFPPTDHLIAPWQHWYDSLCELASLPNIAVKCSGWEMVDREFQQARLNKQLSVILNTFGVNKVMLASNFPLCLFSHKSYQDYWLSIIQSDFFQKLTMQEKSALCYHNALNWYSM